jgi:hypothetical protein
VALEVLRSEGKAFEVSSILGPRRVSVRRRFRSLFAGFEHQSGSVLWFARMALYRALSGVGGTVLWWFLRWVLRASSSGALGMTVLEEAIAEEITGR